MMPNFVKNQSAIVFSESFEARDYLRNLANDCGLTAVCLEKEAICFDNLGSIAPRFIIAQTNSSDVVWRFLFSINALAKDCQLLIVSDSLKDEGFTTNGIGVPLHFATMSSTRAKLLKLMAELIGPQSTTAVKANLSVFLGETGAIKKIRSQLAGVGDSLDPVLITGEEGTGKELLARSIADFSEGEIFFIRIDCGSLKKESLIQGRLRKLMTEDAGSRPIIIFFNSIHLMSMRIQAEILLILDLADHWNNRTSAAGPSAIRVIASSQVSIDNLVEEGTFRKDLYYRLNVIPIQIPPLRDRKADISLLMDYFVIHECTVRNKSIIIPSRRAREALCLYRWPGNVGELKTYMQRVSIAGNESCIFANNNIPKVMKNKREYFLKTAGAEELPKPHEIKKSLPDMNDYSLKSICEEFIVRTEKKLMQKALETTNWNRKKAAALLNISYKSMLNKMKAYDII